LTGKSAGCDAHCVEATMKNFRGCDWYDLKCHKMRHLEQEHLAGASLIIVPGGDVWPDRRQDRNYGQLAALGRRGSAAVCNAVRAGAVYLGICAGAFLALELGGLGLAGKLRTVHRRRFGFEASGTIKRNISLSQGRKAVQELLPSITPMLKSAYYENGPLLQVCGESADVNVLATFPWLRDLPEMYGQAAVVACRVGKGVAILISPHPEFTSGCHNMIPCLATAAKSWAMGAHYEQPMVDIIKPKCGDAKRLAEITGHSLDACLAVLAETKGDAQEAAEILLDAR